MMFSKELEDSFVFNVSSNLPNFSQRNNEYIDEITNKNIAHSMCNVTSYCMAYSYCGGKFPNNSKKYTQEEDKFLEYIRNNKDVNEYYKKLLPVFYKSWKNNEKDNYPPEQIHDVLSYAFNKYVEYNASSFCEKTDIDSMIKEIINNGRPMVLSGKFGKLNHIVCLVGIKTDKKIAEHLNERNLIKYVKNFIIDDPYGDYHTEYKIQKGNDIEVSVEDFIKIFKPVENTDFKMCHYFYKLPSTV